jgi:hypothetical protein
VNEAGSATISALAAHSVRSLYPYALAEGEGVGTAYEYVAKAAFMQPVVRQLESVGAARAASAKNGAPRIVVAGLPEKYGTSLDFAILAHGIGADLAIVDDRAAALARAEHAIGAAQRAGRLAGLRVTFEAIISLADVARRPPVDAVLSCEVLQRIDPPARREFVDGVRRLAPRGAVFVPNSENGSHLKISGLKGLTGAELSALAPGAEWGYVDMPPFPPGITRSADQRSRASTGTLEAIAMRGLDVYCQAEPLVPAAVKKHFAHIVCARWTA